MRIRTRIFIGTLVVVGVGFLLLLLWLVDDLEPQYRKATEEPLVDASRILASIAGNTVKDGEIDVGMFRRVFDDVKSRTFSAVIYDFEKRMVDHRVYMTDSSGKVLFDSHDEDNLGRDFSKWNDVFLTLRGEYGTRTTHENPEDPESSVMYVASPIMVDGELVGVLSVGKPTQAANEFVKSSKRKILIGGTVICLLVIFFSMVVSGMVTRPVQTLTGYAGAVRDGKRVELPQLGRSEIGKLGKAFEEMRDALEGKQYVEHYVQTLTHEVKSPLAAIRGAVELLKEDMPQEQRERFLANIDSEAGRVQGVVEKLLLLSSLESRKAIHEAEDIDLVEVVEDALRSLRPIAEKKDLRVEFGQKEKAEFEGDRFLVRQAVSNLIMNALEFSPEGETVALGVRSREDGLVVFSVRDKGPGVPDYALERVHERFYSLKRPYTGRKSSGLGLAIVREVAELHGGWSGLENAADGGAVATLTLPREHRTDTA
jgi:two-component system sensor histidine kinase CreC